MPDTKALADRRLIWEFAARFAVGVLICVILLLPNAPGWTVATRGAFFVIAAAYLLWNTAVAVLAFRGARRLSVFAESAIAVDGLVLTALVHFTGGGMSPFLLLAVPMVLGLYLVRGGRAALAGAVSLAACLTAWATVVLRLAPVPSAFHVLGEPYAAPLRDNLVFLATFTGIGAVLLLLASAGVMFLAQRSARLARELAEANRLRAEADQELSDALRRLDQLSAVSNRMADVLRMLSQTPPPGEGPQFRN